MSPGRIHPTAIIDPKAEIDTDVEIGPYTVIEAGVSIASGTKIGPHVHIEGLTAIGRNSQIGTGALIGHAPQHIAYRGAPTRVVIGDGNIIRECVSIHRAFLEDGSTVIGNNCFLMGFSHIAHDCGLGDGVIMANNAMLAGHVTIGDKVFISSFTGVHQFCRVGRLAMVGGMARVVQDVPPFMTIEGSPAFIRTINKVGMERAGFSPEARLEIKRLYKALYRSGKTVPAAIAELNGADFTPEGRELIDFYLTSKRGVTSFAAYRKHEMAE